MSVYGEMNAARRSMSDISRRLTELSQDAEANADEIKKLRAEYESLEAELSCLTSEARREAREEAEWDERDYDNDE